jgi:hypothetical protein
VSTEQNKELNELMEDLSIETPDEVLEGNILDLRSLRVLHEGNLEAFKAARADMITKRAALKKSIAIMDKRIEISVATIKVLNTPT